MNELNIELTLKYVHENFPPKTKFISLFGVLDIVGDDAKYYVLQDDCFILGISGEYRLIYKHGHSWAKIIQEDAEISCESDENFCKAIQKFRTDYPSVTLADIQTFAIGWREAIKTKQELIVCDYECASGVSYHSCHIHADSIKGCLDCGNFKHKE